MTNDAATTHAALVAARVATRGRVIGLLGDPVARSRLQERILGGGGRVVELVSLPEIAARQAIADLKPVTPSVRVAAILGTGPLAEALAVEAARAATADDSRPRLCLAGFSPARLTATSGLTGRVEIVTPPEPDPRAIGTWLRAAAAETRCYLCPPASIGDALAVADAGGDGILVLLLVDEASEDVALATVEMLAEIGDRRVRVVDVNAGVHGPKLLSFGTIEEIARAKHAAVPPGRARQGRHDALQAGDARVGGARRDHQQ